MLTQQYLLRGEALTVNAVEHEDDLDEFETWYRAEMLKGPIGFDTETTGLKTYTGDSLRTAQFGNSTTGWFIPVESWGIAQDCVRNALKAIPMLVAHNASFDLQVAAQHLGIPMGELWPKFQDTKILGHLIDPRSAEDNLMLVDKGLPSEHKAWRPGAPFGHSLEDLLKKYVDKKAAEEVKSLMAKLARGHKTTKAHIFETIPLDDANYALYSGLDPVWAVRLFHILNPLVPAQSRHLISYEHELAAVCATVEQQGFERDEEYCQALSDKFRAEEKEALWHLDTFFDLTTANSPTQLVEVLEEEFHFPREQFALTPKGNPSVDSKLLESLEEENPEIGSIGHFASAVIEAKRKSKWRTSWVNKFIDNADADGRVHASINPLRARTARMCLPLSERLVTRRGVLGIESVVEGDETLDQAGNWVRINAIHRYDNAPVVEYRSIRRGKPARYALRSTPEHRWVQVSSKGNVDVRPITAETQTKVRLAPFTGLDPLSTEGGFIRDTHGEIVAGLVGLLVTDGRFAPGRRPGDGYSALIYQTERKFYKEIMELIPPQLVSYDRITDGADHHEIGLRVRELRKLLPTELFTDGVGLKHSRVLVDWCNALPTNECAAFLRACYLADGSTATGHRIISAKPPYLQEAMRMSGYRCGWLSTVQQSKPSEWGKCPREFLSFRRSTFSLTSMTKNETNEPVWCVSTDTGTFTAEGELGIYLTGNSITGIPAQTLPSRDWTVRRCFRADDGHVQASIDYDSQELRVLAALSQDPVMMHAFENGLDLHQITADAIGHPRKVGKAVNFGSVYGIGARKLALDIGAPESEGKQILRTFRETYQGVAEYSKYMQSLAQQHGFITTPLGRVLPVDEERPFAAVNYVVQSTSRDITCRGVLNLHKHGFTPYLRLIIHDEVLMSFPEEHAQWMTDAVVSLMGTELRGVDISASGEIGGRSWGSLYSCQITPGCGKPKHKPAEACEPSEFAAKWKDLVAA